MRAKDLDTRLSAVYESDVWTNATDDRRPSIENSLSLFELRNQDEGDLELLYDSATDEEKKNILEGLTRARRDRFPDYYPKQPEETPKPKAAEGEDEEDPRVHVVREFARDKATQLAELQEASRLTQPSLRFSADNLAQAKENHKFLTKMQAKLHTGKIKEEEFNRIRAMFGNSKLTLKDLGDLDSDYNLAVAAIDAARDVEAMGEWNRDPEQLRIREEMDGLLREELNARIKADPDMLRAPKTATGVKAPWAMPYDRPGTPSSRFKELQEDYVSARKEALYKAGLRPTFAQSMSLGLQEADKQIIKLTPLAESAYNVSTVNRVNDLMERDYMWDEYGDGAPLTPSERRELDRFVISEEYKKLGRFWTVSTLDTLADMAPYAFLHGVAVGAIEKAASSKPMKRLMSRHIYKTYQERFLMKAGKRLVRDSAIATVATILDPNAVMAEAARRARTGQMAVELNEDNRVAYEYLGRPVENVQAKHILQGIALQWTEHFGEEAGGRVLGTLNHMKLTRAALAHSAASRFKIPRAFTAQVEKIAEDFVSKHPKMAAMSKSARHASRVWREGPGKALKELADRVGYHGPLAEIYEEMETAMYQNVLGVGDMEGVDLRRINPFAHPEAWDPTGGGGWDDWAALATALVVPGTPNIAGGTYVFATETKKAFERINAKKEAAFAEERLGETATSIRKRAEAGQATEELREKTVQALPQVQMAKEEQEKTEKRKVALEAAAEATQAKIGALEAEHKKAAESLRNTGKAPGVSMKRIEADLAKERARLKAFNIRLADAEIRRIRAEKKTNEVLDRVRTRLSESPDAVLAKIGRTARRNLSRMHWLGNLVTGRSRARWLKTEEALRTGLRKIETAENFYSVVGPVVDTIISSPRRKGKNETLNAMHRFLISHWLTARYVRGSVAEMANILASMDPFNRNADVVFLQYKDLVTKVVSAYDEGGRDAAELAAANVLATTFGVTLAPTEKVRKSLMEIAHQLTVGRTGAPAEVPITGPRGTKHFRLVATPDVFDAEGRDEVAAGIVTLYTALTPEEEAKSIEDVMRRGIVTLDATTDPRELERVLTERIGPMVDLNRLRQFIDRMGIILAAARNENGLDTEIVVVPPFMVTVAASSVAKKGYLTEGEKDETLRKTSAIHAVNFRDEKTGKVTILVAVDAEVADVVEDQVETIMRYRSELSLEGRATFAKTFFETFIPAYVKMIEQLRIGRNDDESDRVPIRGVENSEMTYRELIDNFNTFADTDPGNYEARFLEFMSKNVAMLIVSEGQMRSGPGYERYWNTKTNRSYRFMMQYMVNNTAGAEEVRKFFGTFLNQALPFDLLPLLGLSTKTSFLDDLRHPLIGRQEATTRFKEVMNQVAADRQDDVFASDDPEIARNTALVLEGRVEELAERFKVPQKKPRKGKKKTEEQNAAELVATWMPKGTEVTAASRKTAEQKQRIYSDRWRRTFKSFKPPFLDGSNGWTTFDRVDIQIILDSDVNEWIRSNGRFSHITSKQLDVLVTRLTPISERPYYASKTWQEKARAYLGGTENRFKRHRVVRLKHLLERFLREHPDEIRQPNETPEERYPDGAPKRPSRPKTPPLSVEASLDNLVRGGSATSSLDKEIDDILDEFDDTEERYSMGEARDAFQMGRNFAYKILLKSKDIPKVATPGVLMTLLAKQERRMIDRKEFGEAGVDPNWLPQMKAYWTGLFEFFGITKVPTPTFRWVRNPLFVSHKETPDIASTVREWSGPEADAIRMIVSRIATEANKVDGDNAEVIYGDVTSDDSTSVLTLDEFAGALADNAVTDGVVDEAIADGEMNAEAQTLYSHEKRAEQFRAQILKSFGFLRSMSQREIGAVMRASQGVRQAIRSEKDFAEYLKSTPANAVEADLLDKIRRTVGFRYQDLVDLYALYRELMASPVGAIVYDRSRKTFSVFMHYAPRLEMQVSRNIQTSLFNETYTAQDAHGFADYVIELAEAVKKLRNDRIPAEERNETTGRMYMFYARLFGFSEDLVRQIDLKATEQEIALFPTMVHYTNDKGEKESAFAGGNLHVQKLLGHTMLARLLFVAGVDNAGMAGAATKFKKSYAKEIDPLIREISRTGHKMSEEVRTRLENELRAKINNLIRDMRYDITHSGIVVDRENKTKGANYLERLLRGLPDSQVPLRFTQVTGQQKNNFVYPNHFQRRMELKRLENLKLDPFALTEADIDLEWAPLQLDGVLETTAGKPVPHYLARKGVKPSDMIPEDLEKAFRRLWDLGETYYPQWIGAFGDKDAVWMVHMKKHLDPHSAELYFKDVIRQMLEGERKIFSTKQIEQKIVESDLKGQARRDLAADLMVEDMQKRARHDKKYTDADMAFRFDYKANLILALQQLWTQKTLAGFKDYTDLTKRMGTALSAGPTLIEELFGYNTINAVTINDPKALPPDLQLKMDQMGGGQKVAEFIRAVQEDMADMTDGFALIPPDAMERFRAGLGYTITKKRMGEELHLMKAIHVGSDGIHKFGAGVLTKEYAEQFEGGAFAFLWKALEEHNKNAIKRGERPIDIIFFGSTDKIGGKNKRAVDLFKIKESADVQFEPAVTLDGNYMFPKLQQIALNDFYWLLGAEHEPEPVPSILPLQIQPTLAEFQEPVADLLRMQDILITERIAEMEKVAKEQRKKGEQPTGLPRRKIESGIRNEGHSLFPVIKQPDSAIPLLNPFTRENAAFGMVKLLQKDFRLKAPIINAVEHPNAAPKSEVPDMVLMKQISTGAWVKVPPGEKRKKGVKYAIRASRASVNVTATDDNPVGGRSTLHFNGKKVKLGGHTVTLPKFSKRADLEDFLIKHIDSFFDMFEFDRATLLDLETLRNLVKPGTKTEEQVRYLKSRIRWYEIDLVDGGYEIPGSPVIIQRVPSDNNYSVTVVRIRQKVPGNANVIVTAFDRQIKAGPDFDIDKRFVMTFFKGEKGGLALHHYEAAFNQFVLNLVNVYANPELFDRLNNTLNHERFKPEIDRGKNREAERNVETLYGLPGTPEATVAAYMNNRLGQKGLGRIAMGMYGANMAAYAGVGLNKPMSFTFNGRQIVLDVLVDKRATPRSFYKVKDALGTILNKYTDHAKLQQIDKIGGNEMTASMLATLLYFNSNLTNEEMTDEKLEAELEKYMETISEILLSPEVEVWADIERNRFRMGGGFITAEKRVEVWNSRVSKLLKERNEARPPVKEIYTILAALTEEMFSITMAMRAHIKLPTTSHQLERVKENFNKVITGVNPLTRRKNLVIVPRPAGVKTWKGADVAYQNVHPIFAAPQRILDFVERWIFDEMPYDGGVVKVLKLRKNVVDRIKTYQRDREARVRRFQDGIERIIVVNGLLRGNFVTYEALTDRIVAALDAIHGLEEFQDNKFLHGISWRKGAGDALASIEVVIKGAQTTPERELAIQLDFDRLPLLLKRDLFRYVVMRYGIRFLSSTGSYIRWISPSIIAAEMTNILEAEREFRNATSDSPLIKSLGDQMTTFLKKAADQRGSSFGGTWKPVRYSPVSEEYFNSRMDQWDTTSNRAAFNAMLKAVALHEIEAAHVIDAAANAIELQRKEWLESSVEIQKSEEARQEQTREARKLIEDTRIREGAERYRGLPRSAGAALSIAAFEHVGGQSDVPLTQKQRDGIRSIFAKYRGVIEALGDLSKPDITVDNLIERTVVEPNIQVALRKFASYRHNTHAIARALFEADLADMNDEQAEEAALKINMMEGNAGRVKELDDIVNAIEAFDGLFNPDALRHSMEIFEEFRTNMHEERVVPLLTQNLLLTENRKLQADLIRYAHDSMRIRKDVGASPAELHKTWRDRTPGDKLLEAFTVLIEYGEAYWSLEAMDANRDRLYTFRKTEPVYAAGKPRTKDNITGYAPIASTVEYVGDIIRNYEAHRIKHPKLKPWLEVLTETSRLWHEARTRENRRAGDPDWIPHRKDYVPHIFQSDEKLSPVERRRIDRGMYRRTSTARTYHDDMINSGKVPAVWDVTVLFDRWVTSATEASLHRSLVQGLTQVKDSAGVVPILVGMNDPNKQKARLPMFDSKTAWSMLRSLHAQLEQLRKYGNVRNLEYPGMSLNPARNPWEQLQVLIGVAGEETMRMIGYRKIRHHGLDENVELWAQAGSSYKVAAHGFTNGISDRLAKSSHAWLWRWALLTRDFNRTIKTLNVSFSAFHHFALMESYAADYGVFKSPFLIPGVSFAIHAVKMIRDYRKLVQDPEEMARWAAAGLQASHIPEEYSYNAISRAMGTFGSWMKWSEKDVKQRNPISRVGGNFVLFASNIKTRVDNFLWTGMVPVMKIRIANRMFEWLRARPDLKHLPDRPLEHIAAEYTNRALGGLEWESMLWATPMMRDFLNLGMFSPDWTLAALGISGLPTIAGRLSGQEARSVAELTSEFFGGPGLQRTVLKYWPGFMLNVMFWIPTITQMLLYMAFGDPDEGDEMWTWKNEKGRKGLIDLTPMLRWWHYNNPWAENPFDTPAPTRRVYASFGKQAREIKHWITAPETTAYGKASTAVRAFGLITAGWKTFHFDTSKNWKVETWAEKAEELGKMMLPFSLSQTLFSGNGEGFADLPPGLANIAPLRKGSSQFVLAQQLEDLYMTKRRPFESWDHVVARIDKGEEELFDAARRNNLSPKELQARARQNVRNKLNAKVWKEFARAKGADIREQDVVDYIVLLYLLDRDSKKVKQGLETSIKTRLKNKNIPLEDRLAVEEVWQSRTLRNLLKAGEQEANARYGKYGRRRSTREE